MLFLTNGAGYNRHSHTQLEPFFTSHRKIDSTRSYM
jgi:hypothetical protein